MLKLSVLKTPLLDKDLPRINQVFIIRSNVKGLCLFGTPKKMTIRTLQKKSQKTKSSSHSAINFKKKIKKSNFQKLITFEGNIK